MVELTSTGPPGVFHYFTRLPPEVRFMIWGWAARSLRTKRGAYFFALQSLSFAELEKATKVDWQLSYQANKGDNWHLHRPSNSPTRNPSTYMIHGGLWAACRDSHQALRHRMQKVRRSVRRQIQAAANGPQRYSHQTVMEVGGTFLRNDKEQMSFTLYPERDLVCLQIPLDQAHLCDYPKSHEAFFHLEIPFSETKRIALEFDPSWNLDLKSKWGYTGPMVGFPCLILDLLEQDARDGSHLWFIDYRLRRNEWKPEVEKPWTLEPGRHVFRGNGCKFVEASSSLDYWDTRSRYYPQPAGTCHHVHTLYRDLKEKIEELADSRIDWRIDNPFDDVWWDGYILRKVGVLACVWDE
ncbi:hypothetical protein PG996_015217 [Apiospora saccharicola]|uniref:2EXR domain-containing protein n=1 Tax=Apiospora saccharicola TaxID=335842 RepID=A0ABR1TKJ1_9PEZI